MNLTSVWQKVQDVESAMRNETVFPLQRQYGLKF